MADITRGKTWTVNESVTNTKLHQLVDSAAINNIASADFALAATQPLHVGSAAPSDATQRGWYDTANSVFRMKDAGGVYQPVSRAQFFTNKSGGTLAAGDVVILDTSNDSAVTTTTTANDTLVFGVILIGGANDATVAVTTEGFCPSITVTGSTDNGDYLSTSTTVKKADPTASNVGGSFARALTTSATSVSAQLGGAAMASTGIAFVGVETVSSTRAKTAASGTQVIAHNLGVAPTFIECASADAQSGAIMVSTGSCRIKGASFAQNSSCSNDSGASGGTLHADAVTAVSTSGKLNMQVGVITAITSTNFTVTFTKTGTPTGGTTYQYEWLLGA